MGQGTYSRDAYARLRSAKGYASKSREEIFESRFLDPEMDPKTIDIRESRDSQEHPESVSVVVALDVTGSMGMIPESIVKETLPDLMDTLIEGGIAHPQVLFLAIGDHVYDNAPLQVGQFESSAELLDRWLTKVYLESGGGGNGGESYHLAWLFSARHTAIDCFEKRGQKGYLFTIGDEPCLPEIPAEIIKRLTPATEASTIPAMDILAEAQEMYRVFHFHVEHGGRTSDGNVLHGWQKMLGQHVVRLPNYEDLSKRIALIVLDDMSGQQHDKATVNITDSDVEDML